MGEKSMNTFLLIIFVLSGLMAWLCGGTEILDQEEVNQTAKELKARRVK